MPALKSSSAAEEEDDQLCPNLEADRFNPEAQGEEDPDDMDQDDDEGGSEEDEDDVKRGEEEEEDEVEAENDEALEEEDSEETSESFDDDEESESPYSGVELTEIRRDVQCPICLGIIRKTRSVMGCLHRFCQECIDKSMRLGNNECPACRKHCASRRSLRDDLRFDAIIASVFGDIDSYEAKELAVHEDDLARRKQIQVSIAQISKKQSEALLKRKSVLPRTQRIGSSSRGRRNCRNMEQETLEEADDDDDDNNSGGEDSSSDEPYAETQQRKRRKRSTPRSTAQPSSSSPNNNHNNVTEEAHHGDSSRGIAPGLVRNPEMLAWGGGGTRSNSRQGGHYQGVSSKNVRTARLNRLVEYLGSLESSSAELDIRLKLISVDANCIPNIPEPYLCCRPTMLVKQLREHVALQTHLKAEEVELLVTKEDDKATEGNISSSSTEKMQSIKDDETMAKLKADCILGQDYLIVAYQQKQIG